MTRSFPDFGSFKRLLFPAGLLLWLSCGGGAPKVTHHTPPAVIKSFSAEPPIIAAGDEVCFKAEFTNGQGVIQPGNIAISGGAEELWYPLTSSGQYKLVVKNLQGEPAEGDFKVSVLVQDNPVAPDLSGPDVVKANGWYRAEVKNPRRGYAYAWTSEGAEIKPSSEAWVEFKPVEGAGAMTLWCEAISVSKQKSLTKGKLSIPLEVELASEKRITEFVFDKQEKPTQIDHRDHSIRIVMPEKTDLRALAPMIKHTGESIDPSSGIVKDFSAARTYTVTAKDKTTQAYTVSVSCESTDGMPRVSDFRVEPSVIALGDEVVFKAFFENGEGTILPEGGDIASGGTGKAFEPSGTNTYTLSVRNNATGLTATSLGVKVEVKPVPDKPVILAPEKVEGGNSYEASVKPLSGYQYTWGAKGVIDKEGLAPLEGASHRVKFTPNGRETVVLTCVATNRKGNRSAVAELPIALAQAPSAAKAITSFKLPGQLNVSIKEAAHTIDVLMPVGSSLKGLKPEIVHTGYGISPSSEIAQDFSQLVTYTVEAVDKSTQAYVVRVACEETPQLESEKPNPVPFGSIVKVKPLFAYGEGMLNGSPVKSGDLIPVGPIKETTKVLLTVKSPFGSNNSASIEIIPQEVSVVVSPKEGVVTVGDTVKFTARVTGAEDDRATWSSGVDAQGGWVAPQEPKEYALTASSVADPRKSATAKIKVVAMPTAALKAEPSNPLFGGEGWITPTWTGGISAELDINGAKVALSADQNGKPKSLGAITGKVTCRLVVKNEAGKAAPAASVEVNPQQVVIGAITPLDPIVTGGGPRTFTAAVTGAADPRLEWYASAGSMNKETGVWTAPSVETKLTVLITAKSVADLNTQSDGSIDVIAKPRISKFTVSPEYIDLDVEGTTLDVGITAEFEGDSAELWVSSNNGVLTTAPRLECVCKSGELVRSRATAPVRKPGPLKPYPDPDNPPPGEERTAITTYWVIVKNLAGEATSQKKTVNASRTFPSGDYFRATCVPLNNFQFMAFSKKASFRVDSLNNQNIPIFPIEKGRDLFSTTLLRDGRLLITGGQIENTPQSTVELYDPKTDQFSPVGSMADARFGHTATLMPDGRVLIVGGQGAVGVLDSMEVFDPKTQMFTPVDARLNQARAFHTADLLGDGRLVLCAGQGSEGLLPGIEGLELQTFTSSLIAECSPRCFHASTLLADGRVLLTGGEVDGVATDSVQVLDPKTGKLEALEKLPGARAGHQAWLQDGRVFCFGGSGDALRMLDCLDLKKGTWQRHEQEADVQTIALDKEGVSVVMKSPATRSASFKWSRIQF